MESEPPAPKIDLHDKQRAANESLSHIEVATPAAPPAPVAAAPAAPQNDALAARIQELEAQLAEARQPAPPKREPLKLELDDTFEPEAKSALQKLVDQLNKRDDEREREHQAAMSKIGEKVGKLEGEHQLSLEERKLTKLLDALPNDHYRAVFDGEDSNDLYRAAAAEVQALREFDKSKGRKRSDAELFRVAAISLYTEKADAIRAKGGRPRRDRTINSPTAPVTARMEPGLRAAKHAWRQRMAEYGTSVLDAGDEEDIGFDN